MSAEEPKAEEATMADVDALARRLMALGMVVNQLKAMLFPEVAKLQDRVEALEKHLGIEVIEEADDVQPG